jgi:acyl carrier protein
VSPFDQYRQLLTRAFPEVSVDDLEPETALVDLGFDSVALLQLVVQVEEVFDINFPDHMLSAETFESVESLWLVISELSDSARRAR